MNKLFSFFLLIFLFSCSTRSTPIKSEISVMTYNVENLFDLAHAQGKQDFSYLPMTLKKGELKSAVDMYCRTIKNASWKKDCENLDWNQERLQAKLNRLAQVVVESTSGCPDLLLLQEVENMSVVQQLNLKAQCGYDYTAISDDRDVRGIDVALLSKYPIKSFKTLDIPFKKISAVQRKDTRGILEAIVSLEAADHSGLQTLRDLRVWVLHLPAPFHPYTLRQEALDFLKQRFDEDKSLPTIIGGDWNIPDEEELEFGLVKNLRSDFFISEDSIRPTNPNRGSYYYDKGKSWSYLDRLAFNRNFFHEVKCRLVDEIPGQLDEKLRPLSFSLYGPLSTGVSDHLPILCRVNY